MERNRWTPSFDAAGYLIDQTEVIQIMESKADGGKSERE
jgi:hypothetical protein